MSGAVSYRRQSQTVRPPAGCRTEYLRLLGDVQEHMDGTVTVTPSSRKMELMLEGVKTFWARSRRAA